MFEALRHMLFPASVAADEMRLQMNNKMQRVTSILDRKDDKAREVALALLEELGQVRIDG